MAQIRRPAAIWAGVTLLSPMCRTSPCRCRSASTVSPASIEAGLTVLADLQRQGLVRHIGLSNVTPAQIAAGRRICAIVCVQNRYNLAHRSDDGLIDRLADDRIAYVPFFPLGGLAALQSSILSDGARLF